MIKHKRLPYCRAKACGSPLVPGLAYCEFHLARSQVVAAKARATLYRKALASAGIDVRLSNKATEAEDTGELC